MNISLLVMKGTEKAEIQIVLQQVNSFQIETLLQCRTQ